MNVYLEALERGRALTATHHERAGAQTRAHFDKHPECRREILSISEAGLVVRGQNEINVTQRCFAGWFEAVVPKKKNKPIQHLWVLPVDEETGNVRTVDILPAVRRWSLECQREAARMKAEAPMKQVPLFIMPPVAQMAMGVQ